MSKVVVRSVDANGTDWAIRSVMEQLDWQSIVPVNAKVVIKLNLNTPEQDKVESANTSPEMVEALCRVLQERTKDISLVESHSYRYTAELGFTNTGYHGVSERLGVRLVNLSDSPCRPAGNDLLGPLPSVFLDADVFITTPVVKTHALTYFTGSIKNQWGCVPRFDRIALHYALDELLVDLVRIKRPALCIMDGIIGVDGRGPTNGRPRRLGLVLGSPDPVALDATAMRLVGLRPELCRHVVLAHEMGHGEISEPAIDLDCPVDRNWKPFQPAELDWAVRWMNNLTKYAFFRKHILEVNAIFYPTKRLVGILRNMGIVR